MNSKPDSEEVTIEISLKGYEKLLEYEKIGKDLYPILKEESK